jgi:hypothetical protein
MKHITPQAQNYIFKEKSNNKPLPFQESNGFITLDELKVLEKKRKFTMESDSDTDDVSNYDKTTTNDETVDETNTTDGKETFDGNEVSDEEYEENDDGEEEENFENEVNEVNEENEENEENEVNEENEENEEENEDEIECKKSSRHNDHKCSSLKIKKNRTQKIIKMEFDVVEDTW